MNRRRNHSVGKVGADDFFNWYLFGDNLVKTWNQCCLYEYR